MSRARSLGAACALAAAALLLATAVAPAAVTVGSDLSPDPVQAPSGAGTGPRTLATLELPGAQIASPIDGVVVRWRVRAAGSDSGGNEVRLKVVRPQPGGSYTGVSTSATRTVSTTGAATFTFATAQAVRAGDLIGLDIGGPNGNFLVQTAIQGGVHVARWQPLPLLDGQTRSPDNDPFGFDYGEHTFNADVEPDADCDGLGDETQDPGVLAGGCNPAPPPAPNSDLLELKAAKRKPLKRLAVRASCFEDCQMKVKGAVKSAGDRFKLRPRKLELGSDEIRRVGLRVKSARKRARLTSLIAEDERAVARIVGVARVGDRVDRERVKIRLVAPKHG